MAKKKPAVSPTSRWKAVLFIIVGLWVVSLLTAFVFETMYGDEDLSGDVAVIPVYGVISVSGSGYLGDSGVSSDTVIELIEKAKENNVKAIILDINSPGGSPVASEEIARAIQRTNITTVAQMRDVAASGGFWIATAADHVFASPLSITGSIGVISSYLEFSGLLEENNVTYQRMVAGKYKDLGSPFKQLTDEERALFQGKLDAMHEYFIKAVATNRGMEYAEVEEHATGMIFTGYEAQELGFVDHLGDRHDVIQFLEKELNASVSPVEYKKEKGFIEALTGAFNGHALGQGIASGLAGDEPIVRT